LSALGIYPVNPAEGTWVLGSPLFPEATLDLGGGQRFTIRARGVSEENRYVQSARLNGRPLERSFLRHDEIAAGGVLELRMGPEPSDWGTALHARPPSASDGPMAHSAMDSPGAPAAAHSAMDSPGGRPSAYSAIPSPHDLPPTPRWPPP
jgi:putative alpha-1,2-mannosidase